MTSSRTTSPPLLAGAWAALVVTLVAFVVPFGVVGVGGVAHAQNITAPLPSAEPRRAVDSVAVRFYAPETGGAGRPLFVTERMLAFESRVEAMTEGFQDSKAPYLERHARAALEHHVAQEMLSRLPLEHSPTAVDLEKLIADITQSLVTRYGGREAMTLAANAEGIAPAEVDAMLRREARAALYVDRALSPILKPTEDQLREVYRTAAHPYRSLSFSQARADLERWFVAERIRVAESSYLQTARTRVKIIGVAR